jgi:hypothetical protein
MLLLKLNEELGIELDFVVYVFFTSRMLFSAKRRRMLKVYAAILAIKVRHVYYYRELKQSTNIYEIIIVFTNILAIIMTKK